MKTTKIYATLAGAYAAVEKAGATRFVYEGAYTKSLDNILAHTYKFANKRTLAKWNLVKYENTLCTLECTTTQDGKTTYKWTTVGHFDSDGLLYPVADASVQAELRWLEKDNPNKLFTKKPRTRKPTPAKGNKLDFSQVEGKTKSARNKSAHALIVGMGVKVGTPEYKSLWEEWTKVR